MRFKVAYDAVAFALAATVVRGDSMCVIKHENSGMLFETPCDSLPLHNKDGGGTGGMVKMEPRVIFETSTVVVVATVTANSLPTAQTTSSGKNLELLYGCNAAPNDFIICPFDGPTPPAGMVQTSTAPVLNVQRDAPLSSEEASAASVLASMVAATNLWPTGVHPFVAPTQTASSTSDCVDTLAEEFALNVIYAASPPAGFVKNKAASNLGINLINGTLIDTLNRLGSIVANRQLQFDAFGQAGSIYTAGFQACGPSDKKLLALGGSTTWWGCVSGSFMNLYDQSIAPQCVKLQLSLLNNLNPGGDLHAVDQTASAGFEPVSISTTLSSEDLRPTAVDKRATFDAPSNTWLHTMLLDSTPVSVWVPYPVFTTDGVVWSATKTKLHGTHATYVGGPVTTTHAKRNEIYDGVVFDVLTVFQDMTTVVTVDLAGETIEMAVSTGDDDTMETITVQPSKITKTIPAGTIPMNEKREEAVEMPANGTATTTASLVFNPVTTTSITEAVTSAVSQFITSVTVIETSTITMESANATSASTESFTDKVSTVIETQAETATTTHSNESTQLVIVPQSSTSNETTSFVTAEAATITDTPAANSTTHTIVFSTITDSQRSFNGTIQSSFTSYNISTFTATGLNLTHASSTLLSTSTNFGPTTTTEAVLSGSIGGGPPAASTTVAISGTNGKANYSNGLVPICTTLLVGLTIAYFADKYLGRLHF